MTCLKSNYGDLDSIEELSWFGSANEQYQFCIVKVARYTHRYKYILMCDINGIRRVEQGIVLTQLQ